MNLREHKSVWFDWVFNTPYEAKMRIKPQYGPQITQYTLWPIKNVSTRWKYEYILELWIKCIIAIVITQQLETTEKTTTNKWNWIRTNQLAQLQGHSWILRCAFGCVSWRLVYLLRTTVTRIYNSLQHMLKITVFLKETSITNISAMNNCTALITMKLYSILLKQCWILIAHITLKAATTVNSDIIWEVSVMLIWSGWRSVWRNILQYRLRD